MKDNTIWTLTVVNDFAMDETYHLIEMINLCKPLGPKVLNIRPTDDGFILKTKPFNTTELAMSINDMPDISKYQQV